MPPAQRTGISSVRPIVEVTLRLSGTSVGVSVDTAAGELGDQIAPEQQPDRQGGIEPPGNQQHRPRADKAERRGVARRNGDAVRLDTAEPRQASAPRYRARPLPVPPMAITASASSSRKRRVERTRPRRRPRRRLRPGATSIVPAPRRSPVTSPSLPQARCESAARESSLL